MTISFPGSPSNGDVYSPGAPAPDYVYRSSAGVWQVVGSALLSSVNLWTAAQRGDVLALTDAATVAIDMDLANNFSLTIGGNRTLGNPTNETAGQAGQITITQGVSGSHTLAYASNWVFPGGTAPTLSSAAGAVDILSYYVFDATHIAISSGLDFS